MVNQVAVTAVIIEKVLNSAGVDLVFTELVVAVSDSVKIRWVGKSVSSRSLFNNCSEHLQSKPVLNITGSSHR